jgi:hypothetical protein
MDLIYKIGEVQFEKKYIRLSNDINLFTTIEKIIIDGSIINDFEEFFCLENNEGYLHVPNDKIVYDTYSVLWNETKSKLKGADILQIIFYTDDDMKTEFIPNIPTIKKSRREANLILRKHKIKTVLDDNKDNK